MRAGVRRVPQGSHGESGEANRKPSRIRSVMSEIAEGAEKQTLRYERRVDEFLSCIRTASHRDPVDPVNFTRASSFAG